MAGSRDLVDTLLVGAAAVSSNDSGNAVEVVIVGVERGVPETGTPVVGSVALRMASRWAQFACSTPTRVI